MRKTGRKSSRRGFIEAKRSRTFGMKWEDACGEEKKN